MTLVVGDTLYRRYRILSILGQGGMGSVYRAKDQNLGVDVAVKENSFTTEEYAAQFRLEANILATLRHPNLPRVTDHFVLEEEGQYLVMDYIEGEDLRQILEKRGSISEAEAVSIGIAICNALSYLHSRTPPILHRDIKLGNVKITPDGQIYLVDFGLAKIMEGDQPTMIAARAMTPGYSPPEQYGSARTDPRSDIYSLGATLYAALTGFIPEDSLARAVDGLELTPLRKRAPKVSLALAQAIEKALETSPQKRFQTAEEFRVALTGKTDPQAQATPVQPEQPTLKPDSAPVAGKSLPALASISSSSPRRRGFAWFYLFLALLASVVGGMFYTNRALAPAAPTALSPTVSLQAILSTPLPASPTRTLQPSATPRPSSTPSPVPVTASADPILPPSPTPLPDGQGEFVYVSTQAGAPQLFLARPGEPPQALDLGSVTPQGACQPVWSPDGKKLVFISPCSGRALDYPNASLYLYDFESAQVQPLPTVTGGDYDPAWSPDGAMLAFTSLRDGYAQVYLMNLQTQEAQRVTVTDETQPARQPVWSPDGLRLAYAQLRYGAWTIWTISPDASGAAQLVRSGDALNDTSPLWAQPETLYFSQAKRDINAPAFLMRYDLQQEKSVALLPGVPVSDLSLSPGGGWLLFRSTDGRQTDLYLVNLSDLKTVQKLTDDPAEDFDPAWRP